MASIIENARESAVAKHFLHTSLHKQACEALHVVCQVWHCSQMFAVACVHQEKHVGLLKVRACRSGYLPCVPVQLGIHL
jgi:hypothetical protein